MPNMIGRAMIQNFVLLSFFDSHANAKNRLLVKKGSEHPKLDGIFRIPDQAENSLATIVFRLYVIVDFLSSSLSRFTHSLKVSAPFSSHKTAGGINLTLALFCGVQIGIIKVAVR